MCYHCINCGYEMQLRIGVIPFFKQRAHLYNLSQTNLVLHNDVLDSFGRELWEIGAAS